MERQFPRPLAHASTAVLAKELMQFVAAQAQPLQPGERFPGSRDGNFSITPETLAAD
jgi:hypothetical protein